MSVSNDDFLKLYQYFLTRVVIDGDGDIFFMNYYWYDMDEDELYEKAMAALTRFGASGLVYRRILGRNVKCNIDYDIMNFLKYMFLNKDERIWMDCFFVPTESAVKLVEKFLIYFDEENHLKSVTDICEEFREELGRIFDEHGVGFDVDLPYDKLLSLDS